jgi:DNA replication and repair protein RecF
MFEQVHLTHLRNIPEATYDFSRLTAIVGPNGSGKTSVLEAITLLSLTTSWRTEKDTEVVSWHQPVCRVISGECEIAIQVTPYTKRYKIGGVAQKPTEVIGLLPTVLFEPQDMNLLYGPPVKRRQHIDRILSQISRPYLQGCIQVQKILKQRNQLLKGIAEGRNTGKELDFWNQQLSDYREVILNERSAFFSYCNLRVPQFFSSLIPGNHPVDIRHEQSPQLVKHSFLEHLQINQAKEVAAGSSLYGPHREDFTVSWDGYDATASMSRGQSRSLLISLKLAELEYIQERTGKAPVLLLDDIFSELDAERKIRLLELCSPYQVILTTTDVSGIPKPAELEIITM